MRPLVPLPGDLILVEHSEWYAMGDGEQLRVCEQPLWAIVGRDIYVAPRQQVRSFWGPDQGPPDGIRRERLSTSGGPFLTITLCLIPEVEWMGTTTDSFWHWAKYPRAGGGVDYLRTVSQWRLRLLPDSPWIDPDQKRRFIDSVNHPGPIRLACTDCERTDFDGVYRFPPNWTDIKFFQSWAESQSSLDLRIPGVRSSTTWYTHLGLCPNCQESQMGSTFCGDML